MGTDDDDANRTPATLEEVYRAHARFVWRAVRRFGVPDGSVEDVMQEVFLVVRRRLHEYDGRAAMTTWLYSIARGVASNHRRRRLREDQRIRLVDPQPAPAPDPEHTTAENEAAAFVREFVQTLDDDKRLIFELVDLEGQSVADVARATGIKLNTAYSRLRLAREAFQRAVDAWKRERPAARGTA